jgi:hypothetical protein
MAAATRKAHGPSAGGQGIVPQASKRSDRTRGNGGNQFPQAIRQSGLGVDPKNETGKMRTVSRAEFLRGVSALSAGRFPVSPKGCAPAQSPAWRMLSPAASSSATMSLFAISGAASALACQYSRWRLRSQNMQAWVSGG